MIGGVDVDIPTSAGPIALVTAVRAIRQVWRRAVFENATNGDGYPQFDDIPFGTLSELFIYRNKAAKQLWDDEGAVPEAYNTMIHLIADEGGLTAVVDDEVADEIQNILGALRSLLADGVLRNAA
jgi:hypothetical protein